MNRFAAPAMLIATATAAAGAHAYEFRVRFVERVGANDVVLDGGDTILSLPGEEHRIRIQFGVFDDADGPAPEGGYLGWNVGTITVNGGAGNSDEFRNSASGQHNGVGRLVPFNFAPSSGGANGLPAGDPFEALTAIDNTLGAQARVWEIGQPLPPPAIVRGRNTWVSTFEFSILPRSIPNSQNYTIDIAGNLLAALEWRQVGEAVEPTELEPGLVIYAPLADAPRSFNATLTVFTIPTPGAAVLFSLVPLLACARRRRFTL